MTPFLRIYDSVSNLRYRNPAFLSPPSLRDTSPYHKGRHDWWVRHPLTIGEAWGGVPPPLTIRREKGQKRKGDNVLHSIYAFRPNKPKKVTVKTRRYKQDAKDKAFRRGAYSYVRDPRKTQSDNVLRSIYAFRSVERKREPLKRGEGLQIAPEAGRFPAASLLRRK